MFLISRKNLYIYFLLLQVLLGQYCYGQTFSNDSLFDKFRQDILTEQQQHEGWTVFDDETEETYYLLLSTHSIETLLKYTDDSIPAVRAEIFTGLQTKNAGQKVLKEILAKHINDTAKFACMGGDVGIKWTIKEYMQTLVDMGEEHKVPDVDFNAYSGHKKQAHYKYTRRASWYYT